MSKPLFEIRSLPILKARGHRYPVSYVEAGQTKTISIPIGSTSCSPDCYTYPQYHKFYDSIEARRCPVCKKKGEQTKYFIDIGLMMFVQKNQGDIIGKKYGWVNLDYESRIISWEPMVNPLIDALAKYSVRRIMQKCVRLAEIAEINYIKMRNIVREKFAALYDIFKDNKKNRVLTWCRANLQVDQHFNGIILNTSAKPDQFFLFKFVDEVGSAISFEGKQTHINYISSQNIFIIIVVTNKTRKAIDTYVADLTQGMMDNNKLVITEVSMNLTTFKNWFATSYDAQDNALYIHGGEYQSKQNTGKIEKISNIRWNGKSLKFDFQNFFNLPVARSLSATSMSWFENKKNFVIAGGISIKDRTTRYQLQPNLFGYRNQNHQIKEIGLPGSLKQKIGGYSNMIEVPRIPGQEKSGILIFGGNSDFRTDVDRHQFCKMYLWRYGTRTIQLPQKCSNNNYPFLFESTGVLLKTQGEQYIIRALIPAKCSATKATKAFLLEYNIGRNTIKETMINATHIK